MGAPLGRSRRVRLKTEDDISVKIIQKSKSNRLENVYMFCIIQNSNSTCRINAVHLP